jgi:hypothetical protein
MPVLSSTTRVPSPRISSWVMMPTNGWLPWSSLRSRSRPGRFARRDRRFVQEKSVDVPRYAAWIVPLAVVFVFLVLALLTLPLVPRLGASP